MESPAPIDDARAAQPAPVAHGRRGVEAYGMWLAVGALLLLSFAMFADLLLASSPLTLSRPGSDLTSGEADGRAFLFSHIRAGDLPLWDDHLFSGIPGLPDLQSGSLYPLNLLLLPFSLERAIDLHVWLHLCLLGIGICCWVRAMGRHPFACFCAGAIGMFCGPVFLHVYAGHLSNIAAIAWAPWLLLGTQHAVDGRHARGVMIGAVALAMQILSGQVQYVYYTCIAVGIHSVVQLADVRPRGRFLGAMTLLVAVGVALSAAQLLPGLANLSESARGGKGISSDFAAMFSFPPENVLTLIAPGFFGDMTDQTYWGRWYLWEMCLFIGNAGLVLACVGFASSGARERRALGITAAVLFVLALGSYSPLFQLLYSYAPGFKSLRGNSKFTFPGMLFVLALVGYGVDALMHRERPRRAGWISLAAGGACGLMALAVAALAAGPTWRGVLWFMRDSRACYLVPRAFQSQAFMTGAARFAARGLLVSGVTFGLLAAALLSKLKPAHRAAAIGLLAVAEVFAFSAHARVTMDLSNYRETTGLNEVRRYVAAHPTDERVLQVNRPNSALYTGAQNIWGYGAIPQRRYLEFVAWTQGVEPDQATQYVTFRRLDPLFAMLRLRAALTVNGKALRVLEAPAVPMARVQLLSRYRVLPGRDAIFAAMRAPSFDPRAEVLLERAPTPRPVASDTPGTVRVTAASPDWLTIEADVSAPAVLLVTDPYAPSWRATALPGSAQRRYDVLPANYILRAVPLAAGHHRLRMEYVPRGFAVGRWISALAWLGLLGAAGARWRRNPARAG